MDMPLKVMNPCTLNFDPLEKQWVWQGTSWNFHIIGTIGCVMLGGWDFPGCEKIEHAACKILKDESLHFVRTIPAEAGIGFGRAPRALRSRSSQAQKSCCGHRWTAVVLGPRNQ
jgi:hypothetical protein